MKTRPSPVLPLLFALASAVVMAPALAQAPSQAATPAVAPAAESRADALFARWDRNKDRMLSQAEFAAGWAALQWAATLELQLRKQFRLLDGNHDGSLDAGEYSHLELVRRAGKDAPPLSRFDASKDQRLQFAEYVAAVASLGAARQPAVGGK